MSHQAANREHLKADCENCFGLCCVALYYSASEGFPIDKDAGVPCPNLQTNFKCKIHESLRKNGLKGCSAFDCFGAGAKVAQMTFKGRSWQEAPKTAKQMFDIFLIMRQLHEMLWYLTEALTLKQTSSIHDSLHDILNKTEELTMLSPDDILKIDVIAHRFLVNALLKKTSELVRADALKGQKAKINHQSADLIGADLRKTSLIGANLRGACLIAAKLSGCDLKGADVIGADFRDADISGANLTDSLFLTQAQLNVAEGNANTKLPPSLTRPEHWQN